MLPPQLGLTRQFLQHLRGHLPLQHQVAATLQQMAARSLEPLPLREVQQVSGLVLSTYHLTNMSVVIILPLSLFSLCEGSSWPSCRTCCRQACPLCPSS